MKIKLNKEEVLFLEYLLMNEFTFYDGRLDNPTISYKERIEAVRRRKLIKNLLRKISR